MALTKQPTFTERVLSWVSADEATQKASSKSFVDGSANGSAPSAERLPAGLSMKSSVEASLQSPMGLSASSSASSPPNGSAEYSDDFPPLTVARTGQSVWVKRKPGENIHWTNEDFARAFLQWLVSEYPDSRNGWVNVPDLREEFFDRFRAAVGCEYVEDGGLFRGLGKVTEKREQTYTNANGRRYSFTEYRVPKAARG